MGLLVYSGIILSLGEVFAALGIDAWLASLVRDGMPAMAGSPYGFVAVLAAVAFLLRFVVPWMTLATVLALVTIPVAEGLSIHPFVPVLLALVASDHTFLPYVNVGYSLLYFASDGELFSQPRPASPSWWRPSSACSPWWPASPPGSSPASSERLAPADVPLRTR